MAEIINYTDDNIKTLEGVEHIRRRPGMYIGRLGNGEDLGDGIYVLLKEVVDNSIDEFSAGFGKQIQITVDEKSATVRDFGRGIPLNSVVKAVSVLNTGGKYDTKGYKKSVGLNGVGLKAVNALSTHFYVEAFRDGMSSYAEFREGKLVEKKTLDLPETLTDVIACKNPRCITSVEQELPNIFRLTDKKHKVYRCLYCETQAKQ